MDYDRIYDLESLRSNPMNDYTFNLTVIGVVRVITFIMPNAAASLGIVIDLTSRTGSADSYTCGNMAKTYASIGAVFFTANLGFVFARDFGKFCHEHRILKNRRISYGALAGLAVFQVGIVALAFFGCK